MMTRTQSRGRHVSEPSSTSKKVGHATTSTILIIKEDEIGCTIKQAALGIKDKACKAHVAAHLDGCYDAVNA